MRLPKKLDARTATISLVDVIILEAYEPPAVVAQRMPEYHQVKAGCIEIRIFFQLKINPHIRVTQKQTPSGGVVFHQPFFSASFFAPTFTLSSIHPSIIYNRIIDYLSGSSFES